MFWPPKSNFDSIKFDMKLFFGMTARFFSKKFLSSKKFIFWAGNVAKDELQKHIPSNSGSKLFNIYILSHDELLKNFKV